MTSIDELFKGLPSKRKFEPLRDPNEVYKSVKHSSGDSSRHARVDDDDDDIEAGPAPPPEEDDDGDYGPAPPPDEEDEGDDEEGRFFGGGISRTEAHVLDYVEGQDGGGGGGGKGAEGAEEEAAAETYDAAWLRRTALAFEKRINRNAELRARHEGEPTKFISSEADLDGAIRALSIVGEHAALYPELARVGTAASLVSLLAHDNTDIAIAALQVIGELTDEDVVATDAEWTALVDALLAADLVGLLVSNLDRLRDGAEDDELDRAGVYYALGIVENLCASRAPAAAEALGAHDGLVRWLLQRIQREETETGVSQNKQYAAEVLAILAQAAPANRARLAQGGDDDNAIDGLLQCAAAYRRRDPERGSAEDEYMEDLFEALTCLVDEPAGKARFAEAEGVELCLLMLQHGHRSRPPALRLLDHAASGPDPAAADICRRIVDAGGLKPVFTLFMREKKTKNKTALAEHLVGLFASMLRALPADSAERIRLLAKFVEKDYAKTGRLLALRREYAARVQPSDDADAGLFVRQTIDLVLAWLVAEDDGAAATIRAALADRDETLADVRRSLQARLDGIEADAPDSEDARAMLTTLMGFL